MLRKLALAAAATLFTLGAVEATLHMIKLGVHDVMAEWAKYARVLEQDEAGEYMRHPRRTSVFLQGL